MRTTLTHGGVLHDFPKSELISIWKSARSKLGLSSGAFKYIESLIQLTSKQDYLPNSICAVFYSATNLSEKIGMSRRTTIRVEQELEKGGWIKMTCPKRGRRGGYRSDRGDKRIHWASGVNLQPLIDRFADLQEMAQEATIETRALQACREEINATRRLLSEAGYDAEATEAYPRGRPSEISNIEKLRAILETLNGVMSTLMGCGGPPIKPDPSAKIVRPNTNSENNIKTCSRSKPPRPFGQRDFDALATDELKETYRFYKTHNDDLTAMALSCEERCHALNISKHSWELTRRTFGSGTAILFIMIIDRNHQRNISDSYYVDNPQACLSGMAKKQSKGRLNLAGMIAEIKRYVEHPHAS